MTVMGDGGGWFYNGGMVNFLYIVAKGCPLFYEDPPYIDYPPPPILFSILPPPPSHFPVTSNPPFLLFFPLSCFFG